MTSRAKCNRLSIGLTETVPSLLQGELICLPWREMRSDVAAWDKLSSCAAEPNPFFESWYLLPALEALDSEENVSILRLQRNGVLQGLMPIVKQADYYGWPLPHMSNWLHANCFFGTPLVARGAERPFWHALLDWIDAKPGLALFMHLGRVALNGPLHFGLKNVLKTDGRKWAVVKHEERAMLASEQDPDAYLRVSLSQRKRKDLNRRYRRLNELGKVRFEWATGSQGLSTWIEQFLQLEASGWKGNAGSALASDPATSHLFRKSLAGAAEHNKLTRLSLMLDDRPIAMLSTFTTPPGSFGYKTAFDEAFSRYSPGVLLEREYLASLECDDIDWCDSCAASNHSVMNEIWRERRAIGWLSIAIGGPLRRAAFGRIVDKETAGLTAEAQS